MFNGLCCFSTDLPCCFFARSLLCFSFSLYNDYDYLRLHPSSLREKASRFKKFLSLSKKVRNNVLDSIESVVCFQSLGVTENQNRMELAFICIGQNHDGDTDPQGLDRCPTGPDRHNDPQSQSQSQTPSDSPHASENSLNNLSSRTTLSQHPFKYPTLNTTVSNLSVTQHDIVINDNTTHC